MTYYGVALIILGILALAGIIYVQLEIKKIEEEYKLISYSHIIPYHLLLAPLEGI